MPITSDFNDLRSQIEDALNDDESGTFKDTLDNDASEAEIRAFTNELLKSLLDAELLKEPLEGLRQQLKKEEGDLKCIALIENIQIELQKTPKDVEKLVNMLDEVSWCS